MLIPWRPWKRWFPWLLCNNPTIWQPSGRAQHAPQLPQVACFDTSFHRNQPRVAEAFALPRQYTEGGLRRYGFPGLSYEYIASVLPALDGGSEFERTVVAHLGNGASMCAQQVTRVSPRRWVLRRLMACRWERVAGPSTLGSCHTL
jgi:hypothetical protein